VKKAFQIVLLSIVSLLLYSSWSNDSAVKKTIYSYSNPEKLPDDEKIKSIDATSFSFSTRNSNVFQLVKSNASNSVKIFSNAAFTTYSKIIERLFNVLYNNYTLHSNNNLFCSLQKQMLFPFHYHW
jgi:hypothetical protein